MSTASRRWLSIDCLRGAGSLMVFVYHLGLLVWIREWRAGHTVMVYPFAQLFVGVHLFLVVSGFCIHMRVAASGPKAEIRFGSFWARRLRRLYPPYLAAIALTLLCRATVVWLGLRGSGVTTLHAFWSTMIPTGSSDFFKALAVHLLLLFPLDRGADDLFSNWAFWSLALEEQLYLLYLGLLWLRRRIGMERTVLCIAAVTLLWRTVIILGPFHAVPRMFALVSASVPVHKTWEFANQISWLDFGPSRWLEWALGALAVELALGHCVERKIFYSPLVGLVAAGLAMRCQLSQVGWIFTDPLWGVSFFVLTNWLVRSERANSSFSLARPVRRLSAVGLFSYSLYLVHIPLGNLLSTLLGHSLDYELALADTFVLVLPLAYLFYLKVEVPSMAWARRSSRPVAPRS